MSSQEKNGVPAPAEYAAGVGQEPLAARDSALAESSRAADFTLPPFPDVYASPKPDLRTLMEKLGFAPGQYRVEQGGPGQKTVEVYEDRGLLPMEQWGDTRDSKYGGGLVLRSVKCWWKKEGDGLVIYSDIPVELLLGGQNIYDRGEAVKFGATENNVRAARDWWREEQERAEADYRAEKWKFVIKIQSSPVYQCLPLAVRKRVEEVAARNWGTAGLSEVADELRAEWPKAAALSKRVEVGEVLVNFGGSFRRRGILGQNDYWVISSDGSLRSPDACTGGRHRGSNPPEGKKFWEVVGEEDVALHWVAGTMHDAAGTSVCRVSRLPPDGCTAAQRAAVAAIEREIGLLPDSFMVDVEEASRSGERFQAARELYDHLPAYFKRRKGWDMRWDFPELASPSGVHLREDYYGDESRFFLLINHAVGFPERCESRDAQVISTMSCADGVLEFLAYLDNNREWQLNMRWRKLREGEVMSKPPAKSEPPAKPEPAAETMPGDEPPKGGSVNLAKVDLSKFFGGVAKVKR